MSTAPVERISSVMRWLPAMAMPAAHEQFVAGAADPHQVDAAGPFGFWPGQEFRDWQACGNHFRHHRVVAVNDDVDLVFFQDARIDRGGTRRGDAEEDVGDFGGDHGAAPAVGKGVAHGLQQQGLPVVVHPHVGAVHHFRGFPVDAPGVRLNFPRLPALLRRTATILMAFWRMP
jgi:hypothetical protein